MIHDFSNRDDQQAFPYTASTSGQWWAWHTVIDHPLIKPDHPCLAKPGTRNQKIELASTVLGQAVCWFWYLRYEIVENGGLKLFLRSVWRHSAVDWASDYPCPNLARSLFSECEDRSSRSISRSVCLRWGDDDHSERSYHRTAYGRWFALLHIRRKSSRSGLDEPVR